MQRIIIGITFAFIFSSYDDNSKNSLTVYRLADEGLQQSIKSISAATNVTYQAIKEKKEKDYTKALAEIWDIKAMEVKILSQSMINYIQESKDELKKETGANDPNSGAVGWENNTTATDHLFESHGKGKELFEKLIRYKQTVLSVDPKINNRFQNIVNIFSKGFDFENADAKTFSKTFFDHMPVIATYVMLSKFENNVKIIENEIVTFCYSQIGYLDGEAMVDQYDFLVGQSSNYLKAGTELEINAGMGSYSVENKPVIKFDDKLIPLRNGVAELKFKTPTKAGKYFVTINIDYTNRRNGKRESLTKTISYTLIE
jgi:hypothetical protein